MHVLQLVTNEDAPFFRQQVEALEALGVSSDVRSPGGTHSSTESRSLRAYARVARATRRDPPGKYDLIHANYGLMAPAALLQRDLPTVLTLWGSDLLGRLGPFSRACARRMDEVIVMTPEMADRLGTPSHVIPHGIDRERFRPIPRERARARVGWEADGLHVLFPYSADRTIKDFPTAASVVAAVRERLDQPVSLQTVSGVDHALMPFYYNAADALLLTSNREGSPNVVREALACQTPVVSTDVGDVGMRLADVSPSAVCRSRQELIDALTVVLTTDESMESISAASEPTTDEMGRLIKRVYERALDSADPDRPKAEPTAQ